MTSNFTLANQAAAGFKDATHYDLNRPSYPPEAVERLLSSVNVAHQKNAQIIELASGTGKFTELLEGRQENYEIIAIEPHKDMRDAHKAKNLGPKVKVLDGNARSMPIENGWGDTCIAAQAFHWFATEESLKEISRVLKPGAAFGMIWNIEDYNAPQTWASGTQWEQKLKDIIVSLEDGHPRFRHFEWKRVFERQQEIAPPQILKGTLTQNLPLFSSPIGEDSIKWTIWLTDNAIWERYSTLSQIAVLEEPKKTQVRKEVFDALKGSDVERNAKGEVALHGLTYLAWTSRV